MPIKDFKKQALSSLRGNWIISVIACFLAVLLGGVEGFSTSFSVNVNIPLLPDMENDVEQASSFAESIPDEFWTVYFIVLGVAFLISIVFFIIGSAISVGYARFHLDMAKGDKPKLRTLFSHFGQTGTAVAARILVFIRIFIGTIFFIVPGIIAAYQYVLVMQVIADNPGISAREALRESKRLMKGNKWKYFCLNFSFIGWSFLAALTGGIGYYLLIPYMQASFAEFYLYAKRKAMFFI